MHRTPPTVKLEGALVRGQRTVSLHLEHEPFSTTTNTTAATNPTNPTNPNTIKDTQNKNINFCYGINGVETRTLNEKVNEEELGILISVSASKTHESIAKSYLALLRATMLHYGFEGRKATAGNLAFPFSPSDLQVISDQSGTVEYVTVCGTRDPSFIRQHVDILNQVQTYVAEMAGDSERPVKVRCIPCGLKGQPRLHVREKIEKIESEIEKMESDSEKQQEREIKNTSKNQNKPWLQQQPWMTNKLVHLMKKQKKLFDKAKKSKKEIDWSTYRKFKKTTLVKIKQTEADYNYKLYMNKQKETETTSSNKMMGNTEGDNDTWLCNGGQAADFTVHHLIEMNQELLTNLFPITILNNDKNVTSQQVTPQLIEWGEELYGDIQTPASAVSKWNDSKKPIGTKEVNETLGDLAQVVRSKNAGVNEITFDCIFVDALNYENAKSKCYN